MSDLSKVNPLQLPEILNIVGLFLDSAEFLTSIKVCKLWYHTFKPYIAINIDDKIYIKTRLSNGRVFNSVVDSFRKAMSENGQYVRHLHIHQRPILDAITMEPTVKYLETLCIGNVSKSSEIIAVEYPWVKVLTSGERRRLLNGRQREMINGPFIWPERSTGVLYPGAFKYQGVRRLTLAAIDSDWLLTQQFWLFLRANKGLQRLRLDESLHSILEPASTEFFYETLAEFKAMTVFDNGYMSVCLDKMLSLMPKLQYFRRHSSLCNGGILTNTHLQLRILELGSDITTRAFYSLLRYLPNLDQLHTVNFRALEVELTPDEVQTLMSFTPSQLKQWRCNGFTDFTKKIVMQALQWMPAITHVTFKEMNEEIGSKLAMYCNQLEYIRQTSNNGMRNSHLLRILLRQCPNLTTIDAPCYFINQTSFTPRYLRSLSGADGGDDSAELVPWICCSQLKTLCCKIGNIDRLNYDDQALYNKISAPRFTARLPRKRHLAVTLHYERLVAQETKIYTGLAQLTALRVLDIGYKYSPPEYIYDKQVYRWTLQLRLESGLGLLGALTQLEEFGFLGIDHRMEEAEIEWMAQAWPKLKVMHGLEYAQAFSAERWARLRKVMERLRPEVRHESIHLQSRQEPCFI